MIYEHIDEEFFGALARHVQNLPAFSDLRELAWFPISQRRCHLRLFLTPQLTALYPVGPLPSADGVISISSACLSLRNQLVEYQYVASHPPHLYGQLFGPSNVSDTYSLPQTTITHLSRLPTFMRMEVGNHPLVIIKPFSGSSAHAFANLTTLSIIKYLGWSIDF